jgi:hypothetical protein
MPAPLINLDIQGGNQPKPVLSSTLDLPTCILRRFLRYSTYDTNTHTSSHNLHKDRRSATIRYGWLYKKHCIGACIISCLDFGIKKFLWVIGIGA